MHRTLLASALALAAVQPLAAAPPYQDLPSKDLPPVGAAQVSQVAAGGETITDVQAPLGQVSSQALAQGREIYKDLQRALGAAGSRDEIDTRLALNDASRVLDAFYEPAAAQALRRQTAIIRQDLTKEGAKPEPGLWLPLEAELDHALIQAPAEHRARAKQAVQEGRAAAAKGNRKVARQQLEVLEDELDYRWGLLPLSKIRGDVHSAEMALNPDPPYWQGIEEAMTSALQAVRWVTTTEATGWLSAYEATVNARYLLPGDAGRARSALQQAAVNLDGLPNAGLLAKEAHKLAGEVHPELESVEALIRGLRAGLPGAG
ncbi:MAG: YfdX family protein [Chromatiaceae bacterium]|jgi:hypothetical protein|nr:YfdX family protein [Chromatiaceae bacterium]